MTENEFMREMIKAAGGDPDKLPDRLKSTYYNCLINCLNSGGGGGSGGGVSSWNDLTDRPFGYTKECVFPQTQIAFATMEELPGFYVASVQCDFAIEYGVTYLVVYKGVEYTCINTDLNISALGNSGIIGEGEDTGEPFYIVDNDGTLTIATLNEETSVDLTIYKLIAIPISHVFLPEPPLIDLEHEYNQSTQNFKATILRDSAETMKMLEDVKTGVARFKCRYLLTNGNVETRIFYAYLTDITDTEAYLVAHPYWGGNGININILGLYGEIKTNNA